MGVYIALLVLIPLLSVLLRPNSHKGGKYKAFYCLSVGLFFMFIPAFRGINVGLDTYSYWEMFNEVNKPILQVFSELRHEPLYLLLTIMCNRLGNFILLQVIVSFIYIFFVTRMIKNYSSICWVSFLFFFVYGFYYMAFNEMRQAVATGFCCFAIEYILKGDRIRYLVMVVVASLFHYSALILITFAFFKKAPQVKVIHLGIIAALYGVMTTAAYLFLDTMNNILPLQYLQNEETGGYSLLLLQIVTLCYALWYRKDLNKSDFDRLAFYMLALSIVLFPFCHLNPFFFRLERYSWLFMIALVPNTIYRTKAPFIRYPILILYILVGFYQGFSNVYTIDNQIIPYMFFWE